MASRSTLPRLLSTLPLNGHHALVQPTAWVDKYPNSFYKITRTKLRFTPIAAKFPEEDSTSAKASTSKIAAKGKAGAADKGKGRQVEKLDPAKTGFGDETDLEPAGKIWGVLFWNGRPVLSHAGTARSKNPLFKRLAPVPTYPLRPASSTESPPGGHLNVTFPHPTLPEIPECRIRTTLKHDWAPVDFAGLEEGLQTLVGGLRTGVVGRQARRKSKRPHMDGGKIV